MIRVFRKIKKKLLVEGKTRTYLKYAVGEMLLVVVGILIALQINNWNEERKIKDTSEKLFTELYKEYKIVGDNYKSSFEANEHHISFLEDILINWHQLNYKTVSAFRQKHFRLNLSVLFYLSSYSQFSDPKIVIFQKALNDGTINLVNNEFAISISGNYAIINRLNEMIAQEYEMGKEINLHLAKTYGEILLGYEEKRSDDLDSKTLNELFINFRSDGSLKFMIRTRLELAKIRGIILQANYLKIEDDLIKFNNLLDD